VLVLASASPRRSELLQEWGYTFVRVSAPVSEDLPEGILPEDAVKELARRKAFAGYKAWRKRGGDARDLIIGADTLVFLGNQILGKPADEEEAEHMLRALSGRTHKVMTGIALVTGKTMDKSGSNPAGHQEQEVEIDTEVEITTVSFRELSTQEIVEYIATGEPMDKAAAYGIQGGAGKFAEKVDGSLTNVIGLPMERLTARLRERGIVHR